MEDSSYLLRPRMVLLRRETRMTPEIRKFSDRVKQLGRIHYKLLVPVLKSFCCQLCTYTYLYETLETMLHLTYISAI